MKKKLYQHLITYLAVIMILGVIPAYTATAANNVKVKPVDVRMNFNGIELPLPTGQFVFIYKGTTYVPLRFVSYAVQKNVNWNAKEAKVTITDPTPAQLISIKEKMINTSSTKNPSSDYKLLTPVEVKYVFNRQSNNLPKGQLSLMYKGTLYVPIRFVSESAGVSIKWDSNTKTVKGVFKTHTENPTDGSGTSEGNGTNTPSKSAQPEIPATGSPATPVPGGSGDGKVSYESITSNTESKLQSLQAESKSTLLNLAKQYLSASDESTKQKLLAQGQQQLNRLTARFENIVGAAESELKANGYSTDIINQYRNAFQDEIEAGKQLAEGLAG